MREWIRDLVIPVAIALYILTKLDGSIDRMDRTLDDVAIGVQELVRLQEAENRQHAHP